MYLRLVEQSQSISSIFSNTFSILGTGYWMYNFSCLAAYFLRSTWAKDANGNYIEYCHVQKKYSEKIFKDCIIDKIQPDKKRNIYIFGDSHARNYLTGVKKAFPEYNVTYITMSSGCAYTPENQISTDVKSHTNCREYVMRVKDFVKNEVKVNDVVFC